MERATWNGKEIMAMEVAENYELEKEVREASGRKELLCPDSECEQRVLRYCHGDIKEAYFAHLNNEDCDYAQFDKINTSTLKAIRKRLYTHFKSVGYDVKLEVKILDHHYTHLLFVFPTSEKIAVELGTQRTSANQIRFLTEKYKQKNVQVKWIVIGDIKRPVRENHVFFLKRYLLNESVNKDLIVINSDCSEAVQYKVDPNQYIYNGQPLHSENYPDVYHEFSSIDFLTFEGNELSFKGFQQRFSKWLKTKRTAFEKKVENFRKAEKTRAEHEHKIQEQKRPESLISPVQQTTVGQVSLPKKSPLTKTLEERKQEILPHIDQQQYVVKDSDGVRWVKCKTCEKIAPEEEFVGYGGTGELNLGTCRQCSRNGSK
ncbi:MAG: competence protein CoiA family protein [Acutalibacteraceae bacterium]